MQVLTIFCCFTLFAFSVGDKLSVCRKFEINNPKDVSNSCNGGTSFVPGSAGAPGAQGPPGPPGVCKCTGGDISELKKTVDFLKNILSRTQAGIKGYLKKCSAGVTDAKKIPNNYISASSYYPGLLPYNGRLGSATSWSVRKVDANQWLQVDFQKTITVSGVVVQARGNAGQWVKTYKIQYGDDTSSFKTVKTNDDEGNEKDMVFTYDGTASNFRTYMSMGRFPEKVQGRYFRFIPVTYYGWMSVRLDYITC